MNRHIGIVLRKDFLRSDTFSIFDKHDGKILRSIYDFALSPGFLISYFVKQSFSRRVVTGLDVLDVPFFVARSDIFLLHHVLELCYYFLPECDVAKKTFDLVMLLYTCKDICESRLKKKIFLFKLLVSFGFYSDHAPFSLITFSRLCSESIDSIPDSFIHLEIERNIEKWLCLCIGAHPQFSRFKTVHFLKKIGCYEKI